MLAKQLIEQTASETFEPAKYRDTVRSYWKGDSGTMGDLAYRLCGSSDLYHWSGKTPSASINFVTQYRRLSITSCST